MEKLKDHPSLHFYFELSWARKESNPYAIVVFSLPREHCFGSGCRYSSVDLSAPFIMPPRVRVPSTPSTIFQFILFKLYICHLNWNVKRTKINKNWPGLARFLKKTLLWLMAHSLALPWAPIPISPS